MSVTFATKTTTTSVSQRASSSSTSGEMSSLVAGDWEIIDPCPDVHALFIQFNDRFFFGALAGCEVRWSPRMTLCAGVCSYEGRGGLCSIRLSVPLLKLRPRKDLVETLLHEMIHAYLFVTENNRDRDGHGPTFQAHMNRINRESGTNISVYHNFHDEVAEYRQHHWRCNGPCRSRKPYFGWLKRATNRAPGKNDFWWAEHVKNCGGQYEKVKEPEGYGQKKNKGSLKDKTELGSQSEKPLSTKVTASSGTSSKTSSSMDTSGGTQPKISSFFFPGEGHVLGGGRDAPIESKNFWNKSKGKSKDATTKKNQKSEQMDSQPKMCPQVSISTTETVSSISIPTSDRDGSAGVVCPCCTAHISFDLINQHLDQCLVP